MNLAVSVDQKQLLDILLNVGIVRPVFIWGVPGIGKSAIVEQFAADMGLPCVSLLGSQLAPEDIIGVPQIVNGRSVFCPPKMIAREEPYCLFLDELNACSQEVQKAFYSLILEERLKEMDEKERATYAAIGAGLYVKQVEEKYNIELPPEFWHSTAELKNEGKISEEMPSDLIEFMKEHGIESGATFSDYLSGKLGIGSEDQQKMYDALKDTYRKEYPDATDSELNSKINTL